MMTMEDLGPKVGDLVQTYEKHGTGKILVEKEPSGEYTDYVVIIMENNFSEEDQWRQLMVGDRQFLSRTWPFDRLEIII